MIFNVDISADPAILPFIEHGDTQMTKRRDTKQLYADMEIAQRAATPGTFVIADIDGRNQRITTLEAYKAAVTAACAKAKAIHAANVASVRG